jgi:hypothetical protein
VDAYQGAALGVESAWPAFLDGYAEKRMSDMEAANAEQSLFNARPHLERSFHSIPNLA